MSKSSVLGERGNSSSNKLLPAALSMGALFIVALVLSYSMLPGLTKTTYQGDTPAGLSDSDTGLVKASGLPQVQHVPLPEAVKAIYMTQCVVGTKDFRQDLVDLIDETELNAVIIDIKDYTGKLGFDTENPKLKASVSDACGASDMPEFISLLHEKGIYVIARITVFQDPYYSKAHPELAVKRMSDGSVWTDHKGLSFIDVGARPYWDYVIEISKEAFNLGFDELNYDYIRFPSDGNMEDIRFTHSEGKSKTVALEEFFVYLHTALKEPALYAQFEHIGVRGVPVPLTSADLFGMTTTNTDDLNIGQVLERAMPYFDFIAPMVYPSHYPKTWNGFSNPNLYPYEVVNTAMTEAARRAVATSTTVEGFTTKPMYKEEYVFDPVLGATTTNRVFSGLYEKESYSPQMMRPWIQDFDYGGTYDVAEVRAQIQGTYDAGLTSWMIWAPSNRYTRGALNTI